MRSLGSPEDETKFFTESIISNALEILSKIIKNNKEFNTELSNVEVAGDLD